MVNLGYGVEKSKEGSNPGKLIVGMKEKFLFSRKIGNHLHFHCVKKETLNCEIKARLLDDHGKLTLTELGWNHNQDPQGNEEVIRALPPERTQPQKLCTANFSSGTLKTLINRLLRLENKKN